ncbi:MAG: hypothetical protein NZ578_06420 [Candidatus Binatia bacterium]|nr:hypothetical protein [Candidatus Binatia bacterium]
MPSLRRLWFDNRHLLGDKAGQALLTELNALDAQAREEVLTAGDRLATLSLTLAQTFCRHAPAAWRTFGKTEFWRWIQIGERLASQEPASRDGATAYFTVHPRVFARLGLDTAEEWIAIGREILQKSRRLGVHFLQTSAPLLASLPEPCVPRLRAWAQHGSALLGQQGWKGEFLAVAYFDSAQVALPVLSPEEMFHWARLGVLLQDSGPWTFYSSLPEGFVDLAEPERLALLGACQEAARLAAQAAREIFARLPAVLRELSSTERAFLLAFLAPLLRTDPLPLPPLLPLLVPFMKSLRARRLSALQDILLAVAREFPAGVSSLIRALPRALEEAGEDALDAWLATGLTVARSNPAAGLAFFALESRTSLRVLRRSSAGVDLEEVQEVLRQYIHMLSGVPVGIRRQQGLSYPPPLEEFPLSQESLPLPGRVDILPTYEDNFRLLRVFAALQAGRREFGTYEFSLAVLWPDLPPAIRDLLGGDGEPQGGLVDYFRRFPHPDLAEAVFLVIETRRIATLIGRLYRGLRDDLDWVALLPLPSLLPAALLPMVTRLVQAAPPPVTVYDSALLAAAVYLRCCTVLAAARPGHDPASVGSLLYDKTTGDALLDAEVDDSPPPAVLDLPQLTLEPERDEHSGGLPLSPEELRALLDAGVELQIRQGKPDRVPPQGLYVSDLLGKLPGNGEREHPAQELSPLMTQEQRRRTGQVEQTFFYDEWDCHIADYRSRWCRLREIVLAGDAGEFFAATLQRYAALTGAVKQEFQRIRPELYRTVRSLEDGQEIDLDAAITAASDLRAGVSPSPKLYTMRRQTERDVAALFLVDMSASTDEPVEPLVPSYGEDDPDDWLAAWKKGSAPPPPQPRRIIDVMKEALVLMAAALQEIGDAYAIYGFSGQGRHNVEFYHVKSFAETLSPTVKGRIGAIAPRRSTRMGTALRHAVKKLEGIACRVKLLILLSDGFPQDTDYGTDRRSITYGIRDTMMALREAEQAGVLTFCLTVDKAGHDYLREMCEPSRYLVLEDVTSLPAELPKVYQRYIRPFGG